MTAQPTNPGPPLPGGTSADHSRWQAGRRTPALYFGRCPVCRCTRLHRERGWCEVSILGWTIGVAR